MEEINGVGGGGWKKKEGSIIVILFCLVSLREK